MTKQQQVLEFDLAVLHELQDFLEHRHDGEAGDDDQKKLLG